MAAGAGEAVDLAVPENVAIFALQYRCPREALFGAMDVEISDSGDPLAPPIAVHELDLDGGWAAADLPPPIASLRVRGPVEVCARYETHAITVPDTKDSIAQIAAPAGDHWVVSVTTTTNPTDRYFEVWADGRMEELAIETSTTIAATGAYAAEGRIWLLTRSGNLAELQLPGGRVEIVSPEPPVAGASAYLAPALSGAGPPEYVLTYVSRFEQYLLRYDGAWTVLEHFPDSSVSRFGQMVLHHGAIVVPDTVASELYRYDGSEGRQPIEIGTGLAGIGSVDGLGLVLGTESSDLLVETEAGFRPIEGERPAFVVHFILSVDAGFLFAGQGGVGQYHPSIGFCAVDPLALVSEAKRASRSGDDILIFSKNTVFTDTDVTMNLFRRLNPRPDCLD